jgi:hypothetical protein
LLRINFTVAAQELSLQRRSRGRRKDTIKIKLVKNKVRLGDGFTWPLIELVGS